MQSLFPYAQIIIAILLVAFILLQQRGTALGSLFGSDGGSYATRRGVQKHLLVATVGIGTLFIALSLLRFVL